MAYVVMAEAGGLFVIEDLNMVWGPFGLRDENNQARTPACLPAGLPASPYVPHAGMHMYSARHAWQRRCCFARLTC